MYNVAESYSARNTGSEPCYGNDDRRYDQERAFLFRLFATLTLEYYYEYVITFSFVAINSSYKE